MKEEEKPKFQQKKNSMKLFVKYSLFDLSTLKNILKHFCLNFDSIFQSPEKSQKSTFFPRNRNLSQDIPNIQTRQCIDS